LHLFPPQPTHRPRLTRPPRLTHLPGSQHQLLNAPVAQFTDQQFVLAAAVDGVDDVELLRQPAGTSELADDAAVELELVDLAVVERLAVVRVRRVEVLVRARRDADRRWRGDVRNLWLRVAVAVEHLNPLVAGVGDVDVALRIERDAAQRVELADFAAALSPRLDEVAVLVELGDARVAGARRRAVGDVDVAVLVPRDACGAHEAVARNARSRRPGRTASAAATAGWRLASSRRAAARRFGRPGAPGP